MTAKILLQDVWRCGLSWDEILPGELLTRFVSWVAGLEVLQTWMIPRCYFPGTVWKETVDLLEFHVFSDASMKAYGANVYARIPDSNGGFRVAFVTSKGKVAPLKRLTLPRLELLGALVGASLLAFVLKALKLDISKVSYHCWSDSTIVLSWIKSQPSKFKTFVGNRVKDIQDLTNPASWRHVENADNPADLVSRGAPAQILCDNPLWLHGPAWLASPLVLADGKEDIPVEETHDEIDDGTGAGTSLVSGTPENREFALPTNSKRWEPLVSDNLSLDELSEAKKFLLQCLQKSVYGDEIEALARGANLPKHSSLMTLSPFLDEEGYLRIKGRLQLSSLSYQAKHPIILPSHWLTKLLVRSQHILMKHAGVNALLSSLRGCYWIVGVRKLAKGVKRECVRCQRQDGAACNRPVAPLPALRVKQASPFTVTGMDYFGHMFCADQPGEKKYVLLLTCAVVRAIHLELTDSLSLYNFMLAFRSFVSRRGLPSVNFSDNAKTFVAAKYELVKEYRYLAPRWKFIVPRSPWHGGWWERLVRSVKSGLRKSLGTASLTRTELETLLHEIEACINSRPLTFTGDTIDSPDPLTPSHFLIGRGSHFQPEEGLSSDDREVVPPVTSVDLQDRLALQELRLKQFWEVWTKEYLRNLPHVVTKFKTHDSVHSVDISTGTVPENSYASGKPPTTEPEPAPVVTRVGRTVRAPDKLDL
ncbi:uncharacterized protein LOC135486793 [Lineus longissimus]|uniref:uncharacterized protein LOC135486793 n=1 Tax=Lineus longissimus TaxID=88925 RepID=UPI00315C6258